MQKKRKKELMNMKGKYKKRNATGENNSAIACGKMGDGLPQKK